MVAEFAPEGALRELAALLREGGTVISGHVRDPVRPPALGMLVAAGSRAAADRSSYALVVEAVREGYLLHYGEARVVPGVNRDLALLAGDYLYALGLERLAAIGDQDAVRELSDLISLSAQLHAEGSASEELLDALWLASVVAIAAGQTEGHVRAKQALRDAAESARASLDAACAQAADRAGLREALREAADAIHSHA